MPTGSAISAVVKGRYHMIEAKRPPINGNSPLPIPCVTPTYPITLTRFRPENKSGIRAVLRVESALAPTPCKNRNAIKISSFGARLIRPPQMANSTSDGSRTTFLPNLSAK